MSTGLELLTTDEMAQADDLAVQSGIPTLKLMDNAGRAVADAAASMVQPGGRIAVLCGPGNNGGDGFVAARVLQERGFAVRVACHKVRDQLSGDAADVARRWPGDVAAFAHDIADGADLVIDAIFGAGLTRAPDGQTADLIARLQDGFRVLAVDVPSGLDGSTGRAEGPVVQAAKTVTFFRRKPGHLLMPGRVYCGDVVVADIGIPDRVLDTIKPRTAANAADLWRASLQSPARDANKASAHKYDRGHAIVCSGPRFQTGAARLAARAALRAGAGLVTISAPEAGLAEHAAHLNAIMLEPLRRGDGVARALSDPRRNACVIGPGFGVGADTQDAVLQALEGQAAVVLDADALTSFEDQPGTLFAAIAERSSAVVMTPHDGEFARLFPDLMDISSKLERARAAADTSHAVVVLKGADTVVAEPDGYAAINATAPPWLATAGSGDVLAGIVCGCLAQGVPAWHAACAAVWLHGECANRFGPGLISEDLPHMLPAVLSHLYGLDRVSH